MGDSWGEQTSRTGDPLGKSQAWGHAEMLIPRSGALGIEGGTRKGMERPGPGEGHVCPETPVECGDSLKQTLVHAGQREPSPVLGVLGCGSHTNHTLGDSTTLSNIARTWHGEF